MLSINKVHQLIDGHQLPNLHERQTHVLRYCMQNSTVGYVGIESEDCIGKVAI